MRLLWKRESQPEPSEFERRVLPGVPSVFTGADTTLGEMRAMAKDVRDNTCQTQAERGLAISLLAILDLFEKETNDEWLAQALCGWHDAESGRLEGEPFPCQACVAQAKYVIEQAEKEAEDE